ncbi:MAG: Maf family protein [Eubacteriales bacterium]|nr:Maf family protein [Eubacteriales bacterium]MDD4462041.1 Maf family protein [Eubacteriales bacterium]
MPNSDSTPRTLTLVLASGSPRRYELMTRFWPDWPVEVIKPELDETSLLAAWTALPPDRQIEQLCAAKCDALHRQVRLPADYVVLTADTAVVVGGTILGKPADAADAGRMLRLLSGRTHQVLTGLYLDLCLQGQPLQLQAVESTDVRFADLSDEQIDWYLASGEPFDKAGAYGIQGLGAALIETINGCYYNVMGLPVFRLMRLLEQARTHFISTSTDFHLLPWN